MAGFPSFLFLKITKIFGVFSQLTCSTPACSDCFLDYQLSSDSQKRAVKTKRVRQPLSDRSDQRVKDKQIQDSDIGDHKLGKDNFESTFFFQLKTCFE